MKLLEIIALPPTEPGMLPVKIVFIMPLFRKALLARHKMPAAENTAAIIAEMFLFHFLMIWNPAQMPIGESAQ
ncbi:MAG: hypothetical protein BWY68_00834 [bacterium ADurb.Bin400]|nr:MAG: hypothetical protein BWY68_00834 [bacterium ADurb.Bin400]